MSKDTKVGRKRIDRSPDIPNLSHVIAHNIRRLRSVRKLSPVECAERIGCHLATWYRLEAGDRPTLTGRHADEIANMFAVEIYELVKRPRLKA